MTLQKLGICEDPARIRRRKIDDRRGASAVEFALVAPVFIIFFFGIVEFGRVTMSRNVMTQATRVGARKAILDGATASEVKELVRSQLASSGIGDPTIELNPSDPGSAGTGDDVAVTVSVTFSDISWLPLPQYFNDSTLSTTTTMRKEGF